MAALNVIGVLQTRLYRFRSADTGSLRSNPRHFNSYSWRTLTVISVDGVKESANWNTVDVKVVLISIQ